MLSVHAVAFAILRQSNAGMLYAGGDDFLDLFYGTGITSNDASEKLATEGLNKVSVTTAFRCLCGMLQNLDQFTLGLKSLAKTCLPHVAPSSSW